MLLCNIQLVWFFILKCISIILLLLQSLCGFPNQ